ncbi:uncharacterized protein LOC127726448 [Mytilus californianus]|uniref:uncharacterized protein LOC127726448 n=1 Tax=Mytilus californianus TaxID=6549 RepID=UPI002247D0CD|nr:uncharacterized protein LOC127726448 [Mytilus californianus]
MSQSESVSERELRTSRTLTSDGDHLFQQSNERHQYIIRTIRRDIDAIILDVEDNPVVDLSTASTYRDEISKLSEKFEKEANTYFDFLKSYRTKESEIEHASFKVSFYALKAKISVVKQHLSELLPSRSKQDSERTLKSRSSHHSSRHTGSTRNSSLSAQSEILKQTVKLETAKTRLKYAKEEAELLHREATLKAERNVLSMKREVDEAESGLQAVKKALNYDPNDYGESYEPPIIANPVVQYADVDRISERKYRSSKVPDTHNITERRTAEFVEQQRSQHASHLTENDFQANSVNIPVHSLGPLNPTARPFVPTQRNEAQELAKFMVKKDLITSRLISFDDQPSHYSSWKISFQHIMTELDTNPLEQLDLLIKFLGPSSKQHAQNIRCANANNPDTAVRLIWERLDARFGSPEMIESSLHSRIVNFPKLSNNNRKELYELADLAAEIESIRKDEKFATTFAYFDSSLGVNRFVTRLPYSIQEKWTTTANGYKSKNHGAYPPFSFFVPFLQNIAKVRNDPGFLYDNQDTKPTTSRQTRVQNRFRSPAQVSSIKTDIGHSVNRPPIQKQNEDVCPLHGTNHTLNTCRGFRAKPLSERLDLIKQKGLCFKCCGPKRHFRDKCKEDVKCSVCCSRDHPSALHVDITAEPQKKHEEENSKEQISSKCTKICDSIHNTSKSCAKIVLAKVYHSDRPDHFKTVYCVIDDQSNRTLATSDFFNFFRENDTETEYVLASCAGRFVTSGRRASGYVLASLDGSFCLNVPEIIECNDIPNNREEIPSSVVASSYPHMMDIASCIPDIDNQSEIQMLIGRDLIRAHHVIEHRVGADEVPYAQRLPLGWVIVGNVCLGRFHGQKVVNVNKTVILGNGRPTLLSPCDSEMSVKLDPIFDKTKLDEKEGVSIEDQTFLNIMSSGFFKQDDGHWIAPLPFKPNKPSLENNKQIAERRAKSFDMNLRCNSVKRTQVLDFMQKLFDREHAQIAPKLSPGTECWYLPMFAVYHPRKPESVRVVFDSSAKHHGLSLNDVLLKGPDIYNSLLGILLRFRKEAYAVTVDIEQMFHNFRVIDEHRRFLRFLWHKDNDFEKPLTEYQMLVHVFGNSPSPAVATYGLRRTVQRAELDVKDFVSNDFYVDDGLTSCATPEGVIDLVQRTKKTLYENGRLRLHKVASNSRLVLEAFHSDDLAKNLKDLDLGSADLPMQRSLGLSWDTELDEFTFSVSSDIKPFTRRGVLSTINSLYDPIGFAAPVIIRGKLLMRQMLSSSSTIDWDDPLPELLNQQWESWVHSLSELENLRISRKYNGPS